MDWYILLIRNSVPLSRFTSSILCVKCASSCTDCISSIQFFASCFCGSSAWCIGLFLARPLLFVPCTPTSLAIGHLFSSKQPWLARNLGKRMSTSWSWKKTRRWKLGRIKWSGKVRSYLLRREKEHHTVSLSALLHTKKNLKNREKNLQGNFRARKTRRVPRRVPPNHKSAKETRAQRSSRWTLRTCVSFLASQRIEKRELVFCKMRCVVVWWQTLSFYLLSCGCSFFLLHQKP